MKSTSPRMADTKRVVLTMEVVWLSGTSRMVHRMLIPVMLTGREVTPRRSYFTFSVINREWTKESTRAWSSG